MPTYCIPDLSSVPGAFGQFDWWSAAPDPTKLQYYPDNPNWLGAFSLSEGAGANRDMQFRALKGSIAGYPHPFLFLSWVIRDASLNTAGGNLLNVLLGDGTHYVALKVKLNTTSSNLAGTQNSGVFTYSLYTCTVDATEAITNPVVLSSDAADLEATARMWVDVTSPGRGLLTQWAFQLAIPLGVAWAPSALNLPVSGAFKLWYEVWTDTPGPMVVPYQVPTTPPGMHTTAASSQVIPAGLTLAHMLDMSTSGVGCTDAVTISYSGVGVRNVAAGDPARPDQYTIRLDLGQAYPPNMAVNNISPYDENHTPNVASSQFQNQFFAQPNVAGLADPSVIRVRFSLANWGSQLSDPTVNSWRPVPGGEDVQYQAGVSEARFVWPLVADSYTTTLVRNINKYLNHVWNNTLALAPGAQNPHQCMLAELSSTDPNVFITRSSIYVNMNVVSASVHREPALISIEGLKPISAGPRDVYLCLQTFNMPKVATDEDRERLQRPFEARPNLGMTHYESGYHDYEVEDIAALYPTYIVHAYHDSGEKFQLADGRRVPILRPQTAFGYFATHAGPLHGWETRLYGAEKIAENFYRLRVPNHGAKYVETAIQARESANEKPLPDDGLKGCSALVAWLESQGMLGKLVAWLLRPLCNLVGDKAWILLLAIFVVVLLLL